MGASNSIFLASVNIEGDKHLDAVIDFLQKNNPDVVCLQEVFEGDFLVLKEKLGMEGYFAPMTIRQTNNIAGNLVHYGVAILTNLVIEKTYSPFYYFGKSGSIPYAFKNDQNTVNKVLLSISLAKNNKRFTIATTHFTWSDGGKADENQQRDLEKLLEFLDGFDELILCGDFNAPRGGEIFSRIASKYKDNVPPEYETSLDSKLHRAKGLKLMIDGLFSTPHYQVSGVKLSEGVSDHCAITAKIYRFL